MAHLLDALKSVLDLFAPQGWPRLARALPEDADDILRAARRTLHDTQGGRPDNDWEGASPRTVTNRSTISFGGGHDVTEAGSRAGDSREQAIATALGAIENASWQDVEEDPGLVRVVLDAAHQAGHIYWADELEGELDAQTRAANNSDAEVRRLRAAIRTHHMEYSGAESDGFRQVANKRLWAALGDGEEGPGPEEGGR